MPMAPSDLERFKKKLEEMRERLDGSVKQASGEGQDQRSSDESCVDTLQAAPLDRAGKDVKILRQVIRALEKIKENTYGLCDLTGEEISLARLEAMPYAITTVKAQERLEKGLL